MPGPTKSKYLTILLVCLAALFFGSVIWINYREMTDHEDMGWEYSSQRPVMTACYNARTRGIKITDAPYWGPLTPQIADRIGLHHLYIIDPFNRDGPKSKWLSKVDSERALPIPIKGNPIWLYSNGDNVVMIIGRGPDRIQQVTLGDAKRAEIFHDSHRQDLPDLAYDATNGIQSGGDIFRLEIFNEPTTQSTTTGS